MTHRYVCDHGDCDFEVEAESPKAVVRSAKRHEAERHDDVLQRVTVERRLEPA